MPLLLTLVHRFMSFFNSYAYGYWHWGLFVGFVMCGVCRQLMLRNRLFIVNQYYIYMLRSFCDYRNEMTDIKTDKKKKLLHLSPIVSLRVVMLLSAAGGCSCRRTVDSRLLSSSSISIGVCLVV